MKAEIKNEQNFTPFTLEITFESKEEAREFWHRLNIAWGNVEKYLDAECDNPKCITDYRAFNELDSYMERNNLKQ